MCIRDSHIRTLLLTFFFRQMPELIEKGHLFIAQPPLYRIKRGRSENYLNNDAAFENYIIHAGSEGVEIAGSGSKAKLSGQELENMLRDLGKAETDLASLGVEGLGKLVFCGLAVQDDFNRDALNSEKSLGAVLDKAVAWAKSRSDEITSVDIEYRKDEEHSCVWAKVTVSSTEDKTAFAADFSLATSEDLIGLKELLARAETIGQPPFQISTKKEEAQTFPSMFALREGVMERGRTGLQITRFKGLGEMNPEQLWDTTLNPENRSMLRVEIDDVIEADALFTLLMGDSVEPRREFIEENALRVRNLDI